MTSARTYQSVRLLALQRSQSPPGAMLRQASKHAATHLTPPFLFSILQAYVPSIACPPTPQTCPQNR